jgi:pimeloyl-ACP methyl ester carboxylesterase
MPQVHANGININYEASGSGEPLLLLPGTANDHSLWNGQIEEYRKEYRCVAMDPRGAGGTDGGDVRPYSVRLLADDVAALLRTLDITRAHVAGLSLGSAIAQEMAINHPEAVHTLSLHATWGRTADHPHLQRQLEIRKRLAEIGDWALCVANSSLFLFTPRFINDQEAEVVRRERVRVENPPLLETVVQHYTADLGHDAVDRLDLIRCPTLITVGKEDQVTLPEYCRAVQQRIAGSEMVILEGGGHLAIIQAALEFSRCTLEFMRRHPM